MFFVVVVVIVDTILVELEIKLKASLILSQKLQLKSSFYFNVTV